MKRLIPILFVLVLFACQRNLTVERFIQNDSSQIVTVVNPDYDTTYVIAPGSSAMIYSFEILDKEQERESCAWLGDTLIITNEDDSTCDKLVTLEDNWSWVVGGPEKERLQKCTFYVTDSDF